uniref:Uncharacterized protein n=1 Tax=Fagus sylvatica TaxID=28930 RepID=A0A2N9F4Z8_FAGSY
MRLNSAWLVSRLDGSDLGSEARWLGFWLGDFDLGLAWSDHGSMARIAAQWLRGSDLEMILARDLNSVAQWLGSNLAHENRIKIYPTNDEDRVVGAEAADLVRRPVQLPGDGVMVQSRRQAESLASRSPRVLDQMVQLFVFCELRTFVFWELRNSVIYCRD